MSQPIHVCLCNEIISFTNLCQICEWGRLLYQLIFAYQCDKNSSAEMSTKVELRSFRNSVNSFIPPVEGYLEDESWQLSLFLERSLDF